MQQKNFFTVTYFYFYAGHSKYFGTKRNLYRSRTGTILKSMIKVLLNTCTIIIKAPIAVIKQVIADDETAGDVLRAHLFTAWKILTSMTLLRKHFGYTM